MLNHKPSLPCSPLALNFPAQLLFPPPLQCPMLGRSNGRFLIFSFTCWKALPHFLQSPLLKWVYSKTLLWTGIKADLNATIFWKLLWRPLLFLNFKCSEMLYCWEKYFILLALTRFLLSSAFCLWCRDSGFTLDLIWLLVICRINTLHKIIRVHYEAK